MYYVKGVITFRKEEFDAVYSHMFLVPVWLIIIVTTTTMMNIAITIKVKTPANFIA